MADEIFSYEFNIVTDAAVQALKNINAELEESGKKSISHGKQMKQVSDAIDAAVESMVENKEQAKALGNKIKDLLGSYNTLGQKQKAIAEATERTAKNMKRGTDELKAFDNQVKRQGREQLAKEIARQEKAQEKYNQTLKETIEAQKQQNDLARRRKDPKLPYPEVGLSPEQIQATRIGNIREEMQNLADEYSKATEKIRKEKEKQAKRDREIADSIEEAKKKSRIQREKDELEREKHNLRAKTAQTKKEQKRVKDELDAIASAEKQSRLQREKDERERQKAIDKIRTAQTKKEQKRIKEEIIAEDKANKYKLKREDEYAKADIELQELELKKVRENLEKRKQAIKDYYDFINSNKDPRKIPLSKATQFDQARSDIAGSSTDPLGKEATFFAKEYAASLEGAKQSQAKLSSEMVHSSQVIEKAKDKVDEFTLSWKAIGRIIAARFITQMFFTLQNAIRSSVDDAVKLHEAIAEIQTVTSRSHQGLVAYNSTLDRVFELSSSINFTPEDTALAVYESLSNQIGDTTVELLGFIKASGNLAKTTRSTLAQSSDAISSVINSYNLSVSDAADISAKLFTLVDKGRIRLEEVADHIGNASVPASQLGVSFDDVVGSLSAISIAGIPARESLTLVRNILFKLIDPTESMTKLFNTWGVVSGQAAIATFGFSGVIDRLSIEAKKGNEEIAELFGTIRGTRGVLGLVGPNLEKYRAAVDASRESLATYSQIVQEYLSNPGEKFKSLTQQTHNEITKIGVRIVELIAGLSDFAGKTGEGNSRLAVFLGLAAKAAIVLGVVTSASALAVTTGSSLNAALIGLNAAYIVYTANATAAATATGALSIALTALEKHPLLIAFTALVTVLSLVISTMAVFKVSSRKTFESVVSDAENANKDITRSFYDGIIKVFKDTQKAYEAQFRGTLTSLTDRIKLLNDQISELSKNDTVSSVIDKFKKLEDALSDNRISQEIAFTFGDAAELVNAFNTELKDSTYDLKDHSKALEDNMNSYKRQATSIQQVINKLLDLRKASVEAQQEAARGLSQRLTDRNLSALQGNQLAQAQFSVAQNIARQAFNTTDVEEARKLFQIAQQYLQQSEATAYESGSLGSLQRHIAFFNQQDAALSAAQQERERREQVIIDQQGNYLTSKKDELALAYQEDKLLNEAINKEIERRDRVREFYELQRAYLEEYQSKSQEISKNELLNYAEKLKAQEELNRITKEGLEQFRGTEPPGSAGIDRAVNALDNQAKINKAQLEIDQRKEEQREALNAANDLKTANQELIKSADQLNSDFSELAKTVEAAINSIKLSIKEPSDSDFNPSTSAEVALYESNQRILKDVSERFANIKAYAKEDPEGAAAALRNLSDSLKIIVNRQDLPEEIKNQYLQIDDQINAFLNNSQIQNEETRFYNQKLAESVKALQDVEASLRALADAELRKQTEVTSRASGEEEGDFGPGDAETIAAAIDSAIEKRIPMINGVPIERSFDRTPLINGRPAEEVLGPRQEGPLINGRPADQVLGETIRDSTGSAMDQGSTKIYDAIDRGSNRISQAIVDGITRSFIANQRIDPDENTRRFRQEQRRYSIGGTVDSIPAMLSPGEFVVRASQTRKHLNLLQAVNSGYYRGYSNGGIVSNNSQQFNNTFNVSSSNPGMQVSSIVNTIKRQLQQGRVSLAKGRPY